MQEQTSTTFELMDLFLLLKKHFLALIAATVALAVLGGLYTKFLITPQ